MKALPASIFVLCTLVACSDSGGLKPYHADAMIIGQCWAGSRPEEDGQRGSSKNVPKPVTADVPGGKGKISLVAVPGDIVPWRHEYQGFRLLLINRSANEIVFPACDSQLSIICEARDAKGEWKPIEHCPRSGCGNSYHKAFLPAGHYWDFAVPVYHGSRKTQLRFHLRGRYEIYSNEFAGEIEPIQFTNPTQTDSLLRGEWDPNGR